MTIVLCFFFGAPPSNLVLDKSQINFLFFYSLGSGFFFLLEDRIKETRAVDNN